MPTFTRLINYFSFGIYIVLVIRNQFWFWYIIFFFFPSLIYICSHRLTCIFSQLVLFQQRSLGVQLWTLFQGEKYVSCASFVQPRTNSYICFDFRYIIFRFTITFLYCYPRIHWNLQQKGVFRMPNKVNCGLFRLQFFFFLPYSIPG